MGNHSGGNLTPDTLVFTLAFNTYFGVERAFYQLAHNLVLAAPGLRRLRRFGTVAASRQNAQEALDSGAALLVHPGGRPRGPPPLLGAPPGLLPAGARAGSGWRSSRTSPSSPSCRWAGDGALPDLREEFGEEPDVDEVYDHVLRLMQETLAALAAERRFPLIG